MNINQIRYVLETATSSSMRAAAKKLYVSQPALSSSIHELEEELGILIFERTNKGISLTDEGREFISYAKKTVAQYEILEERYLSKNSGKERFSVSTQHYNFCHKSLHRYDQTDGSREIMADYDFDKMIKSDDRATSMEIIAELSGYSVGSGMLSGDTAILQGLVSIKLKEEDPLTIGYITRKGSSLSVYGEAYVKKLLDYKEI